MNLPEKKLFIRRRNGLGQALRIFTGDGFEGQDDPEKGSLRSGMARKVGGQSGTHGEHQEKGGFQGGGG